VLLAGEPGIGKSRLVRALRRPGKRAAYHCKSLLLALSSDQSGSSGYPPSGASRDSRCQWRDQVIRTVQTALTVCCDVHQRVSSRPLSGDQLEPECPLRGQDLAVLLAKRATARGRIFRFDSDTIVEYMHADCSERRSDRTLLS
jgi:hypothetical protein